MPQVEGSMLVARALQTQRADLIFTVVGGPVIEAIGACGQLGMRPIGVHHEQAAVMMAQAAAYVREESVPGVAILASGPAVTNGLTGVHTAWDNCWPVVVLGGSSARSQQGLMPFQEADSVAMMRPITKWAAQVDRAARIPEIISMAFQKAISGRPGPVYVDLPADVLQETVDEEQVRQGRHGDAGWSPPRGDLAEVEEAAWLLREAERPLVLIGKGMRWADVSAADLVHFVEALGLPFIPSPMGRGLIPDDHPLCFSAARSLALRRADVVLVLGARLNWVFGMGRTLAPDARVIQVDIEPSEIGLQREIAVGIHADAGTVVSQIMGEFEGRIDDLGAQRAKSPWQHALREARRKNEAMLDPLLNSDAVPMTPHRMLKEIRDVLPRDAIITVDGQVILASARQVLPSCQPFSRLNSGSNGCMGVGIPFAIGAKLALPERPVISINGDCAFGFNGMEMETSLRYNASVVFVVDNNQGIMGGVLEERMFPDGHDERVAMYRPGIRYDRMMEAFGGYGEHVERPEELRPALERAFAAGRSACIDVMVDPAAIWPIPTAGRASSLMGY